MKKAEADRLRDIANFLDEQAQERYWKTRKYDYLMHWCANEIRKVLIDSGFNGYIDAKYHKVEAKWDLKKEA